MQYIVLLQYCWEGEELERAFGPFTYEDAKQWLREIAEATKAKGRIVQMGNS